MPRAPHSSALLAGRPRAKRSVFSTSRSRTRSMPRNRPMSTRLTRGTGVKPELAACQTKASAASKSALPPVWGASRSSASAIRVRVERSSGGGTALSDMVWVRALEMRATRLPGRRARHSRKGLCDKVLQGWLRPPPVPGCAGRGASCHPGAALHCFTGACRYSPRRFRPPSPCGGGCPIGACRNHELHYSRLRSGRRRTGRL